MKFHVSFSTPHMNISTATLGPLSLSCWEFLSLSWRIHSTLASSCILIFLCDPVYAYPKCLCSRSAVLVLLSSLTGSCHPGTWFLATCMHLTQDIPSSLTFSLVLQTMYLAATWTYSPRYSIDQPLRPNISKMEFITSQLAPLCIPTSKASTLIVT